MGTDPKLREIVVVVFPGFQILDATGPSEVFSQASRIRDAEGRPHAYRLHLVARRDGRVTSSSGIEVVAKPFSDAPRNIDTLVVAGGQGTGAAVADPELVDWVRRTAGRSRRVTSV